MGNSSPNNNHMFLQLTHAKMHANAYVLPPSARQNTQLRDFEIKKSRKAWSLAWFFITVG